MNLDIGAGHNQQNFLVMDALHCDLVRSPFIHVVCDVQHMPFRKGTFEQVTAFHIIEHVENPIQALKECIRVASKLVELETPHRLSLLNVKHEGELEHDKHVCSFRPRWFHRVLKNFRHHLENRVLFPGYIYIHVWIWKAKV